MQKDSFYIILGGFASGIFFRSFFDFGIVFSLFFILLGGVISFVYFLSQEKNFKIFSICLFLIFAGLGMLRFDFADTNKSLVLESYVDQKIVGTALIVDEPESRETNTRLVIKFKNITSAWESSFQVEEGIENNPEEIERKAIITVNHYPKFNYGDEIKIIGTLQETKNFESEDGRDFDYVSYLKKDGIEYQMFYPNTEFVSAGNGNIIKEKLFAIKNAFLQKVRKTIPEPHASLLGGLVVGAKESLGKNLQEDFRKVGLIHIVVLSGYNLTIVADSIMRTLTFLPMSFATLFGAIGIILFAIMTGASATIVRASVMALLVMLARTTGRTSQIIRVLFIAGFLMLLHNPNILVFDPSFQLSFVATLGLIVVSPKIEKHFEFLPARFGLREMAIATIATQIFVLPLLLYMMGDLSLVAIFVNLLVLVFIPATMLFGFLTGIIGFVSLAVSLPFAYATYILLAYELKIVDIFASLPFASFHIPYFPFWLMCAVYGVYFWIFTNFFKSSPISEPAT
ncbi:ComEC/Rec2 family competence protein [Patescibacteria group bacterium]